MIQLQLNSPHSAHHCVQAWPHLIERYRETELGVIRLVMIPHPKSSTDCSQWLHADIEPHGTELMLSCTPQLNSQRMRYSHPMPSTETNSAGTSATTVIQCHSLLIHGSGPARHMNTRPCTVTQLSCELLISLPHPFFFFLCHIILQSVMAVYK